MAMVKSDRSGVIFKTVREALRKEVLVGIPGEFADRAPSPGEKSPPNNALIGYVLETGDPSRNLPARPFLVPGVTSIQGDIAAILTKGITGAFLGNRRAYDTALTQVGLAAVTAVKKQMRDGTFAPLAQATVEARARRRDPETGKLKQDGRSKSARDFLKLQAQGTPDAVLHDAGFAKPLIDTGSLITSIHYVIRDK